jgi:hypothetical protein
VIKLQLGYKPAHFDLIRKALKKEKQQYQHMHSDWAEQQQRAILENTYGKHVVRSCRQPLGADSRAWLPASKK